MKSGVDISDLLGTRGPTIERIVPGCVPSDCEREHLARYQWAARELQGASVHRVLDSASGVGYGSAVLSKAGYDVVSIDCFREAVAFGSSRRWISKPLVGDVLELPFKSNSFDAVVSLETIEHLRRPGGFVKEVARVLKTGGLFLLSTPNAELSEQKNPYHHREFNLEELVAILVNAGFSIGGVLGQRLTLRGRFWERVRGLRRISWEIRRFSRVTRFYSPFAKPLVWCVRATQA